MAQKTTTGDERRHTQKRGQARRDHILNAAVRVIARSGTGAATHREVAKEANVPLAATTYYFKSKSDLLVHAFEHLAQREIRELEDGIKEIPKRLSPEFAAGWWASMIADDLYHKRDDILAEYEMHLDAARREALRATHRRWSDAALAFFKACMLRMGSPEPEIDAALVLCIIAGLQLGDLADPNTRIERETLGPLFRRLLHALVPQV